MITIKRWISLLIVTMVLLSAMTVTPITAASNIILGGVDIGYAVGDYFTKDGKTCLTSDFSDGTCHGHGICIANTDSRCNCLRYWPSKDNCQIDLAATQCFGFARYCQWKVYGYHDGNAPSKFKDLTGKIDITNCTGETLKSKLLGCPVATHIRTGDNGHSMVVASTSNDSIQIVSCNKNGTCVISSKSYTWEAFANYLDGRNGVYYAKAVKDSNSSSTQNSTDPDSYTCPTSTIYYTSPTMKGSAVSWVQAVLFNLGYKIDVDGSYGQKSEAVVKQFQSDNGLEVDGRVGPVTRAKLLELWNAKKQTHVWTVLSESAHPHKEYNQCSCGEIKYTGNNYTSWQESGYETEHPHKSYRICWCGYKEYTGEYQTVHTCDSCLPEKPVLSVLPGTSLDYTSFSWNSASGADYYELIVYNKNDMSTPVEWLYYVPTNHYKMPLPQGDYVAYVASINSALVNSSCWWVYSDKVNFSVSSAGTFAPVASAEYNGNRYEMFDINLPWEVAKVACEELGGHLVTVSSDSELAVIKELSGQGNYTLYWIGISDKDEEGTWKNVTGDVVSYSNWRTGYPDNDNGEEHYGVLLSDGTWGDVSNMYPGKVGFICEYESDNGKDDPTDFTEPSPGVQDKPTDPTIPVVIGLLGDVNEDGKVNIKDATLIQKSIANLTTLTKIGEALADADLNTKINIKDATAIQKHIAGIETGYPIGKPKTK